MPNRQRTKACTGPQGLMPPKRANNTVIGEPKFARGYETIRKIKATALCIKPPRCAYRLRTDKASDVQKEVSPEIYPEGREKIHKNWALTPASCWRLCDSQCIGAVSSSRTPEFPSTVVKMTSAPLPDRHLRARMKSIVTITPSGARRRRRLSESHAGAERRAYTYPCNLGRNHWTMPYCVKPYGWTKIETQQATGYGRQ